MALRTDATFAELQGSHPQAQVRPIPRNVLEHIPEQVLDLDQQQFVKCLRTSPSGSAPGPGGCTNELLRVCLDDCEVLQLLFVFGSRRFGPGQRTTSSQAFHDSNDDSSVEEGWRCSGHCHRDFFPQVGGENIGEAVHERG